MRHRKLRHRKQRLGAHFGLLFGLLAGLASATAIPAIAQSTGAVLLKVNDRVVTESDLLQRLELRLLSIEKSGLPEEARERKVAEARGETLRDLYEEALLLARADELGYSVAPEQLESELTDVVESEAFQRAIANQTEGDRDRVIAQLRTDIAKKITVQEMFRREVQPRVTLNDTDVRSFYDANPDRFRTPDRVRARVVVVKSSESRTNEDLTRIAAEIRAGSANGRPLDEAAGPYIDVGIARPPLDLGWIAKGQLEPEIEAALWESPVGSVIPPFFAEGGVHLVEILERGSGTLLPFAEVREQLDSELRFAQFSEELAVFLYELEQRYRVDPSAQAIPDRTVAAAPIPARSRDDGRAGRVDDAVRAWAAAWSAQNVEDYLGAYAREFRPANGMSRAAWSDQRRERVSKPDFIRVEISDLRTEVDGDDATATFRQAYSSGSYSDEVTKTLELIWQDGGWKIVSEVSR